MHTHFAGNMSQHTMTVLKFDLEHRIRKGFCNGPFNRNRFFFFHEFLHHSLGLAENNSTVLGNGNRMLKMSRELTIHSDNCPVIRQNLNVRRTDVQHRFER